jgi:hypothetical protein
MQGPAEPRTKTPLIAAAAVLPAVARAVQRSPPAAAMLVLTLPPDAGLALHGLAQLCLRDPHGFAETPLLGSSRAASSIASPKLTPRPISSPA